MILFPLMSASEDDDKREGVGRTISRIPFPAESGDFLVSGFDFVKGCAYISFLVIKTLLTVQIARLHYSDFAPDTGLSLTVGFFIRTFHSGRLFPGMRGGADSSS